MTTPVVDRNVNVRRGSRAAIAGVLIASVVGAGLVRYGAMRYRAKTAPTGTVSEVAAGTGSRLSAMPSFATALLLGGLRGPLVMILWTSSESQKAEKKLEDFDTKVEWIRLLQPEFDSVHIFQVWNKAYNISVQMASLANKYSTILDALDYAQRIRSQRPNNINLEIAIADVYFNKLGMSTEKEYYGRRVRQDTQWRQIAGARPGEVGWRRTRLDPMLDQQGRILPEYADELQYIRKYEPFTNGLSPFALAYNYYRRAQILQSEGKQSHLQLSDQVLDSRPALTLKNWSENEMELGRRLELQMFGKPIPAERVDMDLPTAGVGLDQKPTANAGAIGEAISHYRRSAQMGQESIVAYERHLRDFAESANFSTFASHLDHMKAIATLARADANYLAAMRATGAERAKFVEAARQDYQQAIVESEAVQLRYFVDDGVLESIRLQKANLSGMSPAQIHQAMQAVREIVARNAGGQIGMEDRQEYENYIQRATRRLAQLPKAS
jgi:hypothetical protein